VLLKCAYGVYMVLSPETIRWYLAQFLVSDEPSADESGLGITVLSEIGSTNDWALAQCKQGRALPFVCFAEKQTNGRGRRGKQWLQAQNANIAMSLALPCVFEREAIAHLPLAVALSIVRALEEMGVKNCQVKWPNDVLVAGEKIAGILIETIPLAKDKSGEPNNADWAVIIGIGFNYDMSALDADDLMSVAWTDLVSTLSLNKTKMVATSEHVLSRNEVAAILLKNCLEICLAYPDNVSALRSGFEKKYDYCRGKQVALLLNDGKTLQGLATGLSENAELIVKIDGIDQVFHSADVSVRPVV